jgi:hypothetical protein
VLLDFLVVIITGIVITEPTGNLRFLFLEFFLHLPERPAIFCKEFSRLVPFNTFNNSLCNVIK